MRSRSITRQTLTIVLTTQLAFALVLGSAAVLSERYTRMRALEQQIAGRSDSLLGAIQDAEDPGENVTIDPLELRLPPEDRYAVYSDKGKLIGRSPDAGPPLPEDGQMGVSKLRTDGVTYSILRRPAMRIIDRAEHGGVGLRRPVVIVYGSNESHVLHEVFEAVERLLVTIIVASLAAGFITAFLLKRALQPIRELALAAQRVTPASLHFEVPPSATQVEELRPLATTLSELIDRLREAFAKEQRFVGDAAHELKTAVAVVRSSIQVLMLRQRTEAEYVEGLEQTLEDNDRVESLVASMLELARLEQTDASGELQLDLCAAARETCEQMRSLAEAGDVQLVMDATHHAPVRLAADRANTLISNLLTNAIRHSKPGATVAVRVQHEEETIILAVEDTGDGIRPGALPHVFERFYRDDPSRSRSSGGTGLGLAICKSIADAAGATIAIHSVLGQGTKVLVTFHAA